LLSIGIYPITIPACATWDQTAITVAGHQNGAIGTDLASLDYPIDIFIDSNDTLFISDGNNNRVVKYYANATSGILVGGNLIAGSSASLLNQPKGIAVDDMGNVFVGDTSNYRIQKFPSGSTVVIFF
jgi:DNA-binding beta-propeller fold protein YncE